MVNQTKIRVRYKETDQMAVVYHSNYLVWFEIGRTEFFRELGLDYKIMEAEDILVPIVDVRCSYKSPALYDDELIIKTKIVEVKSVKVKFEYEIIRDKSILATGYSVHAFTSKDFKIINLRKQYANIYDKMLASMEK